MKQQAFILMGRSGSGKGTQAALLVESLKKADTSCGVLYIETGAEMRRFIQGQTATRKMAKGITDSGGLQPEFIAIYQWTNVLLNQYNATDHLVFDGTPRKLHEAGALNSIFPFYGIENPCVIHLVVDPAEIEKRLLQRGRTDDTRDGISRRLAWYETEVAPTVDLYRSNPNFRFLDVNGVGPTESVHAEINEKTRPALNWQSRWRTDQPQISQITRIKKNDPPRCFTTSRRAGILPAGCGGFQPPAPLLIPAFIRVICEIRG